MAHSEIQFKVKHLVISTVTGSFKKFECTVQSEKDDFSDASVQFSVESASIDTNTEQRDAHLKSDDFFSAEKYPKTTFVSTGVEKKADDEYILKGNLAIRDVTKPITLKVEYGGQTVDGYGQTKAGFEVTGKLKRQEYNLKWNALTEAGGVVVSDEVRLILNVQFIKQAS